GVTHEGRRHQERVGEALGGTVAGAYQVTRQAWLVAQHLACADQLGAQADAVFVLDLGAQQLKLGLGLGDYQTAREAQSEVGAQVMFQARPHASGLDKKAITFGEEFLSFSGAGAFEVLETEVSGVNLDVQRAGVGAGGFAVEAAAFDEQDLDATPREIRSGGAAEDAAADDENVCGQPPVRTHGCLAY